MDRGCGRREKMPKEVPEKVLKEVPDEVLGKVQDLK